MKTIYRAIAAGLGIFALGLQTWLGASGRETGIVDWLINYFSFFTILTNTLVALTLLAPLVAPQSSLGRFLSRPGVRTAIAGYIIIVSVIYFWLLRHQWSLEGWAFVADFLLHYAMPIIFVVDWLFFVPKGGVPWRTALAGLTYPLVYITWTLLHGAVAGWYPYPFVDVTTLGYPAVFANIAGMFLLFLGIGLALVALDRLLAPLWRQAEET